MLSASFSRATSWFLCSVFLDKSWRLQAQCVHLEGRQAVRYDVLSINVGISPSGQGIPGSLEYSTPVKPVSRCVGLSAVTAHKILKCKPASIFNVHKFQTCASWMLLSCQMSWRSAQSLRILGRGSLFLHQVDPS